MFSRVPMTLQVNPESRLGRNGYQEIQEHPWFAEINWEDLAARKIKAPLQPKLKNLNDLSNFANYDSEMPPPPKTKRSNRNLWHMWEWVDTSDLAIHSVTAANSPDV